jgi:phosphoribosylglycinamide formyltransferase 2
MELPKTILLLGSGELGKELVISLKRLGCYVIACDNYSGAPAHQVSDEIEVFDMLDASKLKEVVSRRNPDIIIPEIEAIRTEILVDLEESGIQIVPNAAAVNYTMNRDKIRDLVSKELGIRTAKYEYAESITECKTAALNLSYPLIMKPVMSSSGKGQSLVQSELEINQSWEYACSGMRGDRERVILEEFIDFDYEITLLTIRQASGPTLFCSPIVHEQERGDYQRSWQPIKMDKKLLGRAQAIAEKVTTRLGGAGLFGVELFIKGDEVIFSEISPRPHDTGMVTLISQNLSEFDLHARSALGLPIPEIKITNFGASHVVLADQDANSVSYTGIDEALNIRGVDVRIFGKQKTRPNRRMAVCLATGSDVNEAKENAREASKLIKLIYRN